MEGGEEEMEVELVFEAREVDPDYEFDAPMFFDFTSEESLLESRVAEDWFLTAPSYSPSPFVAKLLWREENGDIDRGGGGGPEVSGTEVFDKGDCEEMYRRILSTLQSDNTNQVSSQQLGLATDLSLFNHLATDNSKTKVRSTMKPKVSRSSTLMKPTASMLAKQNRPPFRFQNPLAQNERSLCNSSGVENQAAKRQKLEGGHLLKVGEAKQQNDFIHKEPKRDGNVDKASVLAKLRLTIPREPDLETANRAQRIRPKSGMVCKQSTVTERGFKARPLNRRILEAPLLPIPKRSIPKLPDFQEFHLKTSERAMQQTAAVFSLPQCNAIDQGLDKPGNLSAADIGKRESRRPSTLDTPKQDGCGSTYAFKARPLNKKIFSSKGDIGLVRNTKREVTVPMEFNFQTEKRVQHNPPIDLFSKLSLTSEVQPNSASQFQFPRSSCISTKGSKENRLLPFQTEHKMTLPVREPLHMFGEKQNQLIDGCMKEVGNHLSMRSLGIG